jgi:hypothetical protein
MSVWWLTGQCYAGGKMFEIKHCLEGSFNQCFLKNIERTIVITPERFIIAQRLKKETCERDGFGMTLTQYLKLKTVRRESTSPSFEEPVS